MESGLLMNALVCFAVTASTLSFAYLLHKNKNKWNEISQPSLKALTVFWMLVGIYYLLEGTRIGLFVLGTSDIGMYIYEIASIPFVLISVPLVYYIIYILTGNKRISFAVCLVFALFGEIYLISMYKLGISEPAISFWGSVYSVNSDLAIITYISGLFIVPTSMILGLILLIFFGKLADPLKTRIVFSLFSISFVFDFILVNFIAQTGEMQMAARIFVFIGSIFGYLALFQPESLKTRPHFIQYEGEDDEFGQI